jgi:hypothetical protein
MNERSILLASTWDDPEKEVKWRLSEGILFATNEEEEVY